MERTLARYRVRRQLSTRARRRSFSIKTLGAALIVALWRRAWEWQQAGLVEVFRQLAGGSAVASRGMPAAAGALGPAGAAEARETVP
ncbi:MAG: hypothetical protein ACLQBX_09000 [Candidatus Limnocylindrales bacterium]